MGLETGLADEAPIHFHTVHEERWKAASQWPPHANSSKWFLHADGGLSRDAPAIESRIPYQVRFTTSTGTSSRFERLGALAVANFYHDWNKRQDAMLNFTTAPFETDIELTGHAIVNLHISTSEHDASVFVYLSEVDADGRAWYITEGALRMLHRAEGKCPPSYRTTWPFRTFHRDEARQVTPDFAEPLRFALLPISWKVTEGSRLRLSIAGTDADHFMQVPHGRPPRLETAIGGGRSFVELPALGV